MVLASLAASLLALFLQGPEPSGTVHGQVRVEGSGGAIPGARVEVVDTRPQRSVASDSAGGYRLVDVPAGRRTIRAHRIGYAPLEMEVVIPADRDVELDIWLRMAPIVLAPLRIGGVRRTAASDTVAALDAELGLAGVRAIQSSPGLSEFGLADAVKGLPGEDPSDPTDVLYVRGTGADLKLVYLDGAPVYAPFPLGGLIDPFTPDLLASADVYLGGAPARYDGGLSYILDLRTRAARSGRFRTSGSMDMLASRAMAEVPLGSRAGVLVSGRGVHDLGTGWVSGERLPYGYREGLVRGDVDLGRAGSVSVTAFGNRERVWVDSTGTEGPAINWGNVAGSVRYSALVGETAVEVTGSVGHFRTELPLGTTSLRLAEASSRRGRIAADLVSRVEGVTLRYGAAFERQQQQYRARASAADTVWQDVGRRGEAAEAGMYLDAGVQLAPRLRVRGGLRADHFSLEDRVLLAPRLAATLMLTDRAALTLAAGSYHQYLRPSEEAVFAGHEGAPLLPVEPLALARATHVSLSLDQEVGEGVRLGFEGFFKNYSGVPGEVSDANASGMDVWLRRAVGRWQGWLGYSLAWSWTVGEGLGENSFSGRHLLSSGLSAPIGELGRLDLGLVYGAGLPYSGIPLASMPQPASADSRTLAYFDQPETVSAGAAPLLTTTSKPYLRVDLAASRTWSPRWGRSPVEVTPYLRLLNTLGQRDALFYRGSTEDEGAFRPVVVLPIVPVVGMEWRF